MFSNTSLEYSTPFVGRAKELADITARLTNPDCRLLTLTGLGGSGKTRLAIEAAHAVATHFPHGAAFVSLQPLPRSDLLVPAIAQAVSLTFYSANEPQDQLLDFLREKTLLLVLDNFEHLLDGAAFINTILGQAPHLKILITSREGLNLRQEWLYPLEGMSTPPSVYSTSLETYEAVQLFLHQARRIQPNFDLANEHESVVRICMLTAGLPLAIELAASWLKGSSTSGIAHEMQRNLDFLSTTTRNVEERHRSMRAVFDQSWALLGENERHVFAGLSVFAGGFDSHAAKEVAQATFADLATLVEKSLIQITSSNRFSIHEMLRQYAAEQLAAYGEKEAIRAQHSHYFAQLMRGYETALQQPQQRATMQAIEGDFENFRLAWDWSHQHRQMANLDTMLHGLYLFGFLRSRYRETTAIFQHTLDQSVADRPLLGRLLARRWGYLHWWYELQYEEALACIQQALTIAQAEGNTFEIAFCDLMLGYTMISMQRYAEAVGYLETSRARFDAMNEPYYVCWVLHRLGYAHFNLNNHEKATAYTEQSLALARVTQDQVALVVCLYNLGSEYILKNDYLQGGQLCEEALHIATESGHQSKLAHALSLVALCAFFEGDYTTAKEYAERSWAIIEDINSRTFQAYNAAVLILFACLREEYAEGVRLRELTKHQSTNIMGFQLLYWALATLACGINNPAEARMYIQKAIEVSDLEAHPACIFWLAPSAAYVAAATNPNTAVELIAWVFTVQDTALNWACQWPLLEHLRARLYASIDGDTYAIHWEKGKTQTLASISRLLHHEFCARSDVSTEAPLQHLLTAREHEILRLMAAGMTNPQIAAKLVVGAATVKTHTLSIYRKLEVANRTQAIIRAQKLGMLPA